MTLETFFAKFDQFAGAPDAVAKMRELVRHLAVTGKLVAQNIKDEPAGKLVERIAAHKAALAKWTWKHLPNERFRVESAVSARGTLGNRLGRAES